MILLGLNCMLFAQDFSKIKKIKFKEKTDYAKYEPEVLQCCDYILNNPINYFNTDVNYPIAIKFVLNWMDGTKDYTFRIETKMVEVSKSHDALFGVYLAAATKYVLENKEKAKDKDDVFYNSTLMFIEYCENTNNKVKIFGELKKMIKAKNENNLKEYLNLE